MLDAAGEMRCVGIFSNEPIQGSTAAQTYIRQTTTNQTRAYQLHDSATMLLDMFVQEGAGGAGRTRCKCLEGHMLRAILTHDMLPMGRGLQGNLFW